MRRAGVRHTLIACVAAAAGLAVVAAPAQATTIPLDVLGPLGDVHVLYPPFKTDDSYTPTATVAPVGDVNGDGFEDTATMLTAYRSGRPATTWVTFTPVGVPRTVVADKPPWNGLRIEAPAWLYSLTGLGDVNGDGLGEVAVETFKPGGRSPGDIVVVFGSRTPKTVDVEHLGKQGFRIANVTSLVAHGFGTALGGLVFQSSSMISAGDQNGDGRPDLAFRDGFSVRVAYTPAHPAGATVNPSALGKGGFTLAMDTSESQAQWYGPNVDRVGDLNHDGRTDLLVGWGRRDDHIVRATGVVSPGPGAVVHLAQVPSSAKGFELDVPDSTLENSIAVGDQNGDGRRDVGVVTYGDEDHAERPRSMTIGYAPGLGAKRTIRPASNDLAVDFPVPDSNVHDVGDQDGDGRSDLAYSNVVRFSRDGHEGAANPTGLGGALYLPGVEWPIVGSIADRTADGKRELMSAYVLGLPNQGGLWALDIWMSARLPLPRAIDLPVDLGDRLEFGGLFATLGRGVRSLGARASIKLSGPGVGTRTVAAPRVIDANRQRTEALVRIDPARLGLVPGRTYTYRVMLENNRGLVGRSGTRSFVYRPSGFVLRRGTGGPDRIHGGPRRDRVLAGGGADEAWGGRAGDVLDGGGGADDIQGGAGADVLVGGAGRDELDGGAGDDVFEARGGGSDTIDCGAGRDLVRADRHDRVRDCETVRRG